MDVTVDPAFWQSKRVLVTGHTGFKGSWLSLWLESLGAEVTGLALAPATEPNLFDSADVASSTESIIGDVRDVEVVRRAVAAAAPEVVFHLAAQPLVRDSYADPVGTYATNVLGTVNVLEAVREYDGVRAAVNVTSDKCYENRGLDRAYREDDPMGGFDPYSGSKGCSELVTASYRRSFFTDGAAIASARAGNVIGGGDWSKDRLVPDILAAFSAGDRVAIRSPRAIRPWQHVLEPLAGYLTLAQRLCTDRSAAEGWNFGPLEEDHREVAWVVEALANRWGGNAAWAVDGGEHPHEAAVLKLDIAKAQSILGWNPAWSLNQALDRVVGWHRGWVEGADARALTLADIAEYSQPKDDA